MRFVVCCLVALFFAAEGVFAEGGYGSAGSTGSAPAASGYGSAGRTGVLSRVQARRQARIDNRHARRAERQAGYGSAGSTSYGSAGSIGSVVPANESAPVVPEDVGAQKGVFQQGLLVLRQQQPAVDNKKELLATRD